MRAIDAYLQENFGAGVTAKDYQNYMRMYITAMHYYQDVLYGELYKPRRTPRSKRILTPTPNPMPQTA